MEYGKCGKCGGELELIDEWPAVTILQCVRCKEFAFKFTEQVTDDPADAYDQSLLTDKEDV